MAKSNQSESDQRVVAALTRRQVALIREALAAMLYEDAPAHLKNQGFALEPGVDGDIDPDDPEQVAYAKTYQEVMVIEQLLGAAPAVATPTTRNVKNG